MAFDNELWGMIDSRELVRHEGKIATPQENGFTLFHDEKEEPSWDSLSIVKPGLTIDLHGGTFNRGWLDSAWKDQLSTLFKFLDTITPKFLDPYGLYFDLRVGLFDFENCAYEELSKYQGWFYVRAETSRELMYVPGMREAWAAKDCYEVDLLGWSEIVVFIRTLEDMKLAFDRIEYVRLMSEELYLRMASIKDEYAKTCPWNNLP